MKGLPHDPSHLEIVLNIAHRYEQMVETEDGEWEPVVDTTSKTAIYTIMGPEVEYYKPYAGRTTDYIKRRGGYLSDYRSWIAHGRRRSGVYRAAHPKLFAAFDKYGVENFKMIILIVGIPEALLSWAETVAVEMLGAFGAGGLNCTEGGEACTMSARAIYEKMCANEERKAKIRDHAKAKPLDEVRAIGKALAEKYSGSRGPRRGVLDMDTSDAYRTVTDAARFTGFCRHTVMNHCQGRSIYHRRFRWLSDEEQAATTTWAGTGRGRLGGPTAVLHKETGEIYRTIKDASKATGTPPTEITRLAAREEGWERLTNKAAAHRNLTSGEDWVESAVKMLAADGHIAR